MSSFTRPLKYRYVKLSKRSGRKIYEITEEFEYVIGPYENPIGKVVIPKGFRTDLASIPWPLHYLIKPEGKWAKAAVVHDYIVSLMKPYIDKPGYEYVTRITADSIFYEALLVSNVKRYVAYLFYTSVRFWTIMTITIPRFFRRFFSNYEKGNIDDSSK